MTRTICGALLAATVLALGACGSDDTGKTTTTTAGSDRQQILTLIRAYNDAYVDNDYDKACSLMSKEAQDQFVASSATAQKAGTCPKALTAVVGKLSSEQIAIIKKERFKVEAIDGDSGLVNIASGESNPSKVVKVDGQWLMGPD